MEFASLDSQKGKKGDGFVNTRAAVQQCMNPKGEFNRLWISLHENCERVADSLTS